ncbi:MFS transporter [Microbacterium sp. STN6]|uniref:MFS transporter n=1 Tax=Microbacterium sp. STN6 TaxID=2995588 RepID=UPI002260DFEF|nr:MFS transporter [Microbacterium sp. STN6]MCX7522463.1 MFS transporter [Microbacterium sp. STN6]
MRETVTDAASAPPTVGVPPRAWTMLGLGVAAQAAGTVFVSAPAFLIPLLHTERGMSLAQAGLLAAVPTLGMVLTLIAWGALTDRVGERWVIAGGLALTALAALGAVLVQGYVMLGLFLLLGGMAAASTNAASGRVVVGWFPKHRRGLAMGIRQMCQPLGVTIAALTIPTIASSAGVGAAIAVPLVMTAVLAVACAIGIVNPPRPGRARDATASDTAATAATAAATASTAYDTASDTATATATDSPTAPAPSRADAPGTRPANPYRASGFLWRIHAVSVLLVVPQFTLSTFGLVWLTAELHWPALAAGVLVGVAQFVGALGRLAVGVLSDRVGSRVRPLRWVAVAASASMLLLAALDTQHWGAAAVVFVIATTISVADNGLAFTSVAEVAGTQWAGRALGAQNTGQFLAASVVGPAVGGLIGLVGYPLAFALVAACPALAVPLTPAADAEHDRL